MKIHDCDVLIIGAGGAGLRAAIEARAHGVHTLIVDKGVIGQSGTTVSAASDWMAFGAAFGHADPQDNPREHWIDILVKGGLVCKPGLAKRIAFEAPARLMDLERWGVDFDKTPNGKFKQILSDGARYPRACGKGADTGPTIVRVLLEKAQAIGVEFVNGIMIADLLTDDSLRVIGCWGVEKGGEIVIFKAKSTILATGGAGALYALNVFPERMTGDGYALALRAGAKLVNMEFIQIGPSIVHPIRFALSGVFWRLHPRITNVNGDEFICQYIPAGVDMGKAIYLKGVSYPFTVRNESKWVDVAIYSEIVEGRGTEHNGVHMSIAHNSPQVIEEQAKVPLEHLIRYGIDIRKDRIEFAPAIQHFNGGVMINEQAETSIEGLYAAGEVAGGQHGADRPGGNSLADCQVFGKIAGEQAAQRARQLEKPVKIDAKNVELQFKNLLQRKKPVPSFAEEIAKLRWLMWKNVGVKKTAEGLMETLNYIKELRAGFDLTEKDKIERFFEYRNLLDLASAIVRCALERQESRGTHYRADFPQRNDEQWIKQIVICTDESDPKGLKVSKEEVKIPPGLGDLKGMLEGQ